MVFKVGQCIKVTRKDSVMKIKKWEIESIRKVREIGGREYDEFTLRSNKTKIPIQVTERFFRNSEAKEVKC